MLHFKCMRLYRLARSYNSMTHSAAEIECFWCDGEFKQHGLKLLKTQFE